MQLVTALVPLMAAGGGAAAATATTGSSLLMAGSMIGTAFSALATIGAGVAASNQAKSEAAYADFKATDERIKGDQAAADLKKQMALTIARNKVALAAGGVDLGSVSAVDAQTQVAHDAEMALGVSNNNAWRQSLADQAEARRLREQSSSLLLSSVFNAAGTVGQSIFKELAIG